jgi:hypothetical protein
VFVSLGEILYFLQFHLSKKFQIMVLKGFKWFDVNILATC